MKNRILAFCVLFHMVSGSHAQSLDWVRQLGGNTFVYGTEMAVDASGNVYTTGFFDGTADFDPGAGTANLMANGAADAFVSKLDESGNYVWARSIGGSGSTVGTGIFADGSGNVIVVGRFEGTVDFDPGNGVTNLSSAGGFDVFIIKLDASGNLTWAKRTGGMDVDWVKALSVDLSGNIYTTGEFEGTSDFDPGNGTANLSSSGFRDAFISKLDASGNFVWAKRFGGPSTDFGNSIAVDASGNVYSTGFFQGTVDFDPGSGVFNLTTIGNNSPYISKLDASGNFIWAKGIEASGVQSSGTGSAIDVDASGNTYVTGSFIQTMDFDPGTGVVNLTSAGEGDVFVLKLDPSGEYTWAKRIGGTSSEVVTAILVDESERVFTTGYFQGTSDFDPGAGTANLSSAGQFDIFISQLNSSGNYNWAIRLGGVLGDFGESIKLGPNGNLFATGVFLGTVDFDPGPGVVNLTTAPASFSDTYVLKLGGISVGVEENTFDQKISIFPNPTTSDFWVSLGKEYESLETRAYDLMGRVVHTQVDSNSDQIHVTLEAPKGIYFVELVSGTERAVLKLIRE